MPTSDAFDELRAQTSSAFASMVDLSSSRSVRQALNLPGELELITSAAIDRPFQVHILLTNAKSHLTDSAGRLLPDLLLLGKTCFMQDPSPRPVGLGANGHAEDIAVAYLIDWQLDLSKWREIDNLALLLKLPTLRHGQIDHILLGAMATHAPYFLGRLAQEPSRIVRLGHHGLTT